MYKKVLYKIKKIKKKSVCVWGGGGGGWRVRGKI